MANSEAFTDLSRWRVSGKPADEWLASSPEPVAARAMLIRVLDRPGRSGAKLAAACRARGDHPHAEKLHAALVALMYCANCGRPLVDPVSIERGIGPDCWPRIDADWRAAITARLGKEVA